MKKLILIQCFLYFCFPNPSLDLMNARVLEVKNFYHQKKEYVDVALHPHDLEQYFSLKSKEKVEKIVLLYFNQGCRLHSFVDDQSAINPISKVKCLAHKYGYKMEHIQEKREFFSFINRDEFQDFIDNLFEGKSSSVYETHPSKIMAKFCYITLTKRVVHE